MKRYTNIALSVALLAILTGCGKESVQISDEEAINEYILGDPDGWFNLYGTLADSSQDDSVPPGALTQIAGTMNGDTFNFIRGWGRELVNEIVNITMNIHDDTAEVDIDVILNALFHVGGPDTNIIKEFTDYGKRYARFVRTGPPEVRRGWVLDALSMMEMQPDSYTVQIDSVRVTGGDIDTVITDPLEIRPKEDILAFPPGTEVTVAVYVNDPVNTIAYLHYSTPLSPHRRSPRFIYEDGALVGTWVTPSVSGRYRAGVDILRWETLYVPDYPYDTDNWMFVYRVES